MKKELKTEKFYREIDLAKYVNTHNITRQDILTIVTLSNVAQSFILFYYE